ncbi:MAG: acyl-CoA dehydrogenase, partial [Oleiphilaceae bacterium]
MNFDYTEKTQNLINKLQAFMDENIYPNEAIYHDLVHQSENP